MLPDHATITTDRVRHVSKGSTVDGGGLLLALAREVPWPAATRTRPSAGDEAAIIAERHRIAREIHDTLAQGFAAIRFQLELARTQSGLPPQTARALDLAYQIAGDNLVEARRSIAALKATQPSLETSLFAAIEGVRRLDQVRVVDTLAVVPAPPDEVAHELVRIAQEAMLNAARHAQAQTVLVAMTPVPGGLRLAIVDDGKGFDPAKASPGFGLAGLRERAAGIAAKLSIASTPGLGTEVVVTWIRPLTGGRREEPSPL